MILRQAQREILKEIRTKKVQYLKETALYIIAVIIISSMVHYRVIVYRSCTLVQTYNASLWRALCCVQPIQNCIFTSLLSALKFCYETGNIFLLRVAFSETQIHKTLKIQNKNEPK